MGRDTGKDLTEKILSGQHSGRLLRPRTAKYVSQAMAKEISRALEGKKGKARKKAMQVLLLELQA